MDWKGSIMTRRLIKQMLAAQTLSALTVSLCLLIDNVMINRFLGEGAITAYGLANPVLLGIGAFGSLLSAGIQVACSKSLGAGSQAETNKGYSSALAVAAVVSVVFTVAVLILRGFIAWAAGAGWSGALYDQTTDYLAGFVIGAPASMGALVLVPFLQMAGRSGLLIAAVLGMTVSDVAFDLLNVLVFHGGMFGMGLASALSYYVAVGVGLIYFLSPKCVLRFSVRDVKWKKIVELLKGGFPSAFGMAASIVLIAVLNRMLIRSSGGAAAVAAYTVASAIGNASNCVSTGVGGVSLTLSGVLFHEEDRNGLQTLLKNMVRYGLILGAAVLVILMIFAPAAVSVFMPKEGTTRDMAILAVRLFSLGVIPCCLNNALRNIYQGTGRILLIEILSLLEGAVLPILAAVILGNAFGPTGIWLNFVAGETLTLLFICLFVDRARKNLAKDISPFLLLRESFGVSPNELLEREVQSLSDAIQAARDAGQFCLEHGRDGLFASRISLCVEEMASNTVTHGFTEKRENRLSVRIQHKAGKWVLRFRDNCRAFDPVHYVPEEGRPDALGIRLVLGMADEARYTYSLGMNNLTIVLLEQHTGSKDNQNG